MTFQIQISDQPKCIWKGLQIIGHFVQALICRNVFKIPNFYDTVY